MIQYHRSLTMLMLIALVNSGFAQQTPRFSKPVLNQSEEELVITYDILDSDISDIFNIRIEVSDHNNNKVEAKALSGDVGKGVSGGPGKTIRWDLMSDGADAALGFYIQIFGERTFTSKVDDLPSGPTRGGAMLRSVAFPGWGLSKLNPGSKHWIKGVVGYGALAGAGTFYSLSETNYQNYLDSYDPSQRETFLDKSNKQSTYSLVLVAVASAIWITDLVWTLVVSGRSSGNKQTLHRSPVSIGTHYNMEAKAPVLVLKYRF